MPIVLVGYRGSGKSTVGRKLADRLGRAFVDLDDRIVAGAGKTIRQIFAEQGEAAFRDRESQALVEALSEVGQSVLSLGGGAVVRVENRQKLIGANCRAIYLRCGVAELLRRIESDPTTRDSRPSLTELGGKGGGLEEISAVLAVREPMYREVAPDEVDVTLLSVDEAVDRILQLL